jgi:CRP/FNR family transcriptional regulator
MEPPADALVRLERLLQGMPLPLLRDMLQSCEWVRLSRGQEVMRVGQYVRAVPLVLSGTIKVYSQFDEADLLLYYIRARESCVLSFTAVLENAPSRVYARVEEDTEALLMPSRMLPEWVRTYPLLNELIYRQFHQRYDDLLLTLEQVMFRKMDQRVLQYLAHRAALHDTQRVQLRHREIAADLGTAREVVTRVLKKLEMEKRIRQENDGWIELLP